MYSTCLFCHTGLGHNEAIESFTVGRRLAFDAARGRLWVVCPRCARWNLSPLEARFEAVEECERAYRGTRLRASTEQVGLARLREGTELVRIGSPLRPEFAAWRYGEQLASRRRRWMATEAGKTLAQVGAIAGYVYLPFGVVGAIAYGVLGQRIEEWRQRRVVASVADDEGQRLIVMRAHLPHLSVSPGSGADGWSLAVRHAILRPFWHGDDDGPIEGITSRLSGEVARRALGALLPVVNASGGERDIVGLAVQRIERARDADAYVHGALSRMMGARRHLRDPSTPLADVTPSVRLALEMAVHEEEERRALEGELAALERAWRDAEEVARIADDLLVPERVRRALARLRAGRGASTFAARDDAD